MIALLASSSINLLPDLTILPQLAVYLCVFFVLNRWVIQPVLRILQRRNELTLASDNSSAAKQAQVLELQASIAAKLKAERHNVLMQEEEKRKNTEQASRAKVDAARKASQTLLEAERVKLQAEANQAEAEMGKQIAGMKQEIIQRVTHFEEVAS